MQRMAGLEDLISQIPIGDLAKKLGVDESTAKDAVSKALPALVGGMQANAKAGGGESLAKAVDKHSPQLVEGGVNLDDVDEEDGKKIVGNVFGGEQQNVVAALAGGQGGGGGGLGDVIGKALPMLAPMVMSFLAQKGAGTKANAASTGGGGGIGDMLGGLLGGGGGGGAAGSGGGLDIGGLLGGLGGMLGGGKK
jgi:hypothetical protein